MSNVLEFLERVGQDWQLRHADPATLRHVMAQAGIAESLQPVILDHDLRRLEALLSLASNVCCAVHPAHEDDEEVAEDEDFDDDDFDDDEDEDDEDDEDEDDEDDEDDDEDDLDDESAGLRRR
jgi:hypothetical protein